jgi:hypothetical protein
MGVKSVMVVMRHERTSDAEQDKHAASLVLRLGAAGLAPSLLGPVDVFISRLFVSYPAIETG